MWTEKYRPKKLNQLVCPANVMDQLIRLRDMRPRSIPHLALFGSSGVGKTSAAHCLINEWLPDDKARSMMTLEVNASINCGVDYIRDTIIPFMQEERKAQSFQRKIILLDEADSLSREAQSCLRVPLEQYAFNTLVIFTGNSVSGLIPAILSRCLPILLPVPTWLERQRLLQRIAEREGFSVSNVSELEHTDFREAIKLLQVKCLVGIMPPSQKPTFIPTKTPEDMSSMGYSGCAWTKAILQYVLQHNCIANSILATTEAHYLMASGADVASVLTQLLSSLF